MDKQLFIRGRRGLKRGDVVTMATMGKSGPETRRVRILARYPAEKPEERRRPLYAAEEANEW